MVTDEETGVYLEENLNKNTKTKTKSDMKVITDFFTSITIVLARKEHRDRYPPKTLIVCLSRLLYMEPRESGS
jgi:hypothetical protein